MGTFSVRKTTEQFIAEAKAIHGDKYDYSKVQYKTNKDKVCIICPEHSEFWQRPNDHLRSSGCKKCYACSRNRIANLTFDIPDACKNNAPYYKAWISITLRSTNQKFKDAHPTYRDCTICNEWRTLSNFKRWFEDPCNGYQKGLQIDKDTLVKGNKEYAPDKCCFVPQEINSVISIKPKGKSLVIGVKPNANKFEVRLSRYGKRDYIGLFDTKEEAFYAYKNAKERYIQEIAEKYFQEGKITKKVYDALFRYEVEITD